MRCHYPSVRLERGVVNNVDGLGEAGRAAFPMYGTDVGTSEPVEERTKRYPVKRKTSHQLSGNGDVSAITGEPAVHRLLPPYGAFWAWMTERVIGNNFLTAALVFLPALSLYYVTAKRRELTARLPIMPSSGKGSLH